MKKTLNLKIAAVVLMAIIALAALGLVLTAFTFPIVMITRWLTGKVYADVEF